MSGLPRARLLISMFSVAFFGLTTTNFAQAQSGAVVVGASTTWAKGNYQLTSLTVNGGATLTVGGGSSVTVTGAVQVTGNSNIVLEAANNTGQVNGTWQGTGVTINAASVEVDAGSSINADGQGYAPTAGPGGSTAQYIAGSYGGLGATPAGSTTVASPVYGSATAPVDLGSGGGPSPSGGIGGSGGGAIRLVVSGTLTNNGVISANGGGTLNKGSGGTGAGGSVYVTADTLDRKSVV